MLIDLKTKEDIEFHSDGLGRGKPAVNVKVYDSLTNGFSEWRRVNPDEDAKFTQDWIEENVPDEDGSLFWSICEMRWEDLTNEAREIWGHGFYTDGSGARRYRISVYSEGRSGGWAVVNGIDTDVDSWDAVEFNKWRRFAKFARLTADHIMYDICDTIYWNDFIPWSEEQSELFAPSIPEGFPSN